MENSDKEKKSRYEVAGRMFYETHAFGYMVTSFTSSGFLDREGYVIPLLKSTKLEAISKFYFENQTIVMVAISSLFIGINVWIFSRCLRVKKNKLKKE